VNSKMNLKSQIVKQTGFVYRIIFWGLIWLVPLSFLFAEEKAVKDNYRKIESAWLNSDQGFLASLKKSLADEQGWARYVRLSRHNGNLIETGWVNQAQLADGYIDGPSWPMTWPRGSQATEYGYVFNFFVAGEVVDVNGNTIHIVSDRFHRSSNEQSADKTHWYDFKPLPGYFNEHHMNSDDWYVGGIGEDVGPDGFPNTNDEGEGNGVLDSGEDLNKNGILDDEIINVSEFAAMSHMPETWPTWWPPQSYQGDDRAIGEQRPGPAAGRWNGEYGYYIRADQESYYLCDDHENDDQ